MLSPCGDRFELVRHQHSHSFACDFVLDGTRVLVCLEGRTELYVMNFVGVGRIGRAD